MRGIRSGVTGCFFSLLLWSSWSWANSFEARVVRVKDGDTVVVLDQGNKQHEVRLAGIDAPEKKQPFGTRSRRQLADLVFKKSVIVEWEKRDRYKRIVGKLLLTSPRQVCIESDCQSIQDAGLALVAVGLAWHYKQYEREQSVTDRDAYARAEELARAGRRGLWTDARPIPPWEWRRK